VTPLRDGMNLVSMEYVASQDPEHPGVLVLSRFAGSAGILSGALAVNPYDIEDMAEAMDRALAMSQSERVERWESMMKGIRRYTLTGWRESFLEALYGT
jgi:trehalose 6-phosphate synthase